CSIMELFVRKIPNDYSYKKAYLDSKSAKIDYLFLGNSHAYYGIDPALFSKESFNASHVSQSIDYDYEILKKYQQRWNSLKCIFIPIDYFTLYSRIETSKEPWRAKNYEIYYKINKSNKISNHSELFHFKPATTFKRIYSYYIKNEYPITCNEQGYGNKKRKVKDLFESGPKAAIRHTAKNSEAFEQNVKIVNKIINLAKQNDANVVFYTSPSYYTYAEKLDGHQLQKTLQTIKEIILEHDNSSYHNFLTDSSFNQNDFMDADHLNDNGATKFTLKLKKIAYKQQYK
ncbi:MAG: hypothetical protein AAFX55_13295, partial [Bacteroidota bacterium]